MNLGWAWPEISDKASARKAVKEGFWGAIFVVACDVAIAIYTLSVGAKFAGHYDAWVLVDAALFAIIAWRIWRNSRAWAVVGLILMLLEIEDKLRNASSTFGLVTVLLLLAFVNAVRGAFAFHKYSLVEASLNSPGGGLATPAPPGQ